MNWHVFGKAFLCETLYSIPFFILALFPFRKQLRFSLKSITFFIFLGQLFQSICINGFQQVIKGMDTVTLQ